ncbi:maleate cis-trans isomerase family protein [Salibacterium aidingense]|uniref:maleate cis-trans isomerase family protein n=1 Tax=Salibacterium aidingense TaxID=384933 RepID=UPI003BCAEC91
MPVHKNRKMAFLYPGQAAENDFYTMASEMRPAVDIEVIHTSFLEDAHTVEALTEMGSIKRLQEGAERLKGSGAASVLWSSTSASFVLGAAGIQRQVKELKNILGVPASTTALAFVKAARTLNLKKIAVAATYPRDVALIFKQFLQTYEMDVIQYESKGIITAAEVGTLKKREVLDFAENSDAAEAEALLIPDTALHTAGYLKELEETLKKPVLTANQVSFWEALWLAERFTLQQGWGTLFQTNERIDL